MFGRRGLLERFQMAGWSIPIWTVAGIALLGVLPDAIRFNNAPVWWPGEPQSNWWRLWFYCAVVLGVFVIGSVVLPKLLDRVAFEPLRELPSVPPTDLLVLCVSMPGENTVSMLEASSSWTLDTLLQALSGDSWEVPVQVAKEVRPNAVLLLGSSGPDGSVRKGEHLRTALQQALGGIPVSIEGVDFDSLQQGFNDIDEKVRAAAANLRDAKGNGRRWGRKARPPQVTVDLTSGNKQVSIACAMLTMNNDYCITYWNRKDLLAYDVRVLRRNPLLGA